MVCNFVELPFANEEFDFVFDMGCFHHAKSKDRNRYITGVHRVLRRNGHYLLVCFSEKNGHAWNHFTKEEIIQFFSNLFKIKRIEHVSSKEGDGITHYFYQIPMQK